MATRFDLVDPAPFEFRAFDRQLYHAIQKDPEARTAFDRLTRGKRAIHPSWLLFSVGTACSSADPPRQHDAENEWMQKWTDKWEGLGGTAKSLRLLAEKMQIHLGKSDIGPAPLAYMGIDRFEKDYAGRQNAQAVLQTLPPTLFAWAKLVERYCAMQKNWLRGWPTVKEGQKFQTLGLLHWVKERTGRNHFERIAALINVGRRLRRHKEVSGESLRKLWKRYSGQFPGAFRYRTAV